MLHRFFEIHICCCGRPAWRLEGCVARSRLEGSKINFPPYSKQNMREIMVHRLASAADSRARRVFQGRALDFATIKARFLLPRPVCPRESTGYPRHRCAMERMGVLAARCSACTLFGR